MAETAAAPEGEHDPQVNPYSLIEAVNRASDTAHFGWLIFLGVMAYLVIAITGVSHKDLLLQQAVQLPIFGIQVPQIQFFEFAPIILVLFHTGIVAQLVLLARKVFELDISLQKLEPTVRRNHPLRLELHNFFFVQAIGGPERSRVMGVFLHAMSWLTLVVLPVVLLIYIQISFLPYHSVALTWLHRLTILVDVAMLVLIGVFLSENSNSFFGALRRVVWRHPMTTMLTSVVLASVTLFSFFVATVPGEMLDGVIPRRSASGADAGASSQISYDIGFAVPLLSRRSDGSLFGLFHRNLIVTDLDLVVDKDASEGETTLNLRGRDLRYARLDRSDIHQSDLTGAQLDGASLIGTDLRSVRLQCVNLTELMLSDDRKKAQCASARHADFSNARLDGANLSGIDMRSAKVEQASLVKADLFSAIVAGARFGSARLDGAVLAGGVQAQGASFLIASLQGADLSGALLQYADFSSAQLQAANLQHSQLQAAVLRDADLSGAMLAKARLRGADMTGADVSGADMREVRIWLTTPPSEARVWLADFTGSVLAPLDDPERAVLSDAPKVIDDLRLRGLAVESLEPLLDPEQSRSWGQSAAHASWRQYLSQSLRTRTGAISTTGATGFSGELTEYLAQLACRGGPSSQGAIANGLVRRALAAQFLGVRTEIARALAKPECSGGRKMDQNQLQALMAADPGNAR